MKMPICICVAAGLALAGCSQKSSNSASTANAGDTNSTSEHAGLLTAPVDYLGAVAKGQQVSIKVIDISQIKHAIQMFQVDKDRYPKDLNELVQTKYLGKIPAPPYGMKINYDPNTGQVSVVKK